jgi:hypothetical protein
MVALRGIAPPLDGASFGVVEAGCPTRIWARICADSSAEYALVTLRGACIDGGGSDFGFSPGAGSLGGVGAGGGMETGVELRGRVA